jgi:hypothetical protein
VANAFLKAERIVAQGIGLLQRELVLPRLVTRLGREDFVGSKNDTVNVRVPAILEAREYGWRNNRSSPITYDELEELSIPVSLNKHPYSGVKITDEELTLDIASWGEQVAQPQTRAVAEKLESYVAAAIEGANFADSVTYDPPAEPSADDLSFFKALVDASKVLNQANVPMGQRVALLGANVAAAAKLSPHLVKVNESGDDELLREATLGRVAGFTVVESNSVDPDFAAAFHPTAFAFANVAPVVPDGAVAGATITYEGLAIRWIRDYDPDYLQDRSVFSSFAGAASVEDGRAEDGSLNDTNIRAVEIAFAGS